MSDDRRFDKQEVGFEPPPSDEETYDHGKTEPPTGPRRQSDAFPDKLLTEWLV